MGTTFARLGTNWSVPRRVPPSPNVLGTHAPPTLYAQPLAPFALWNPCRSFHAKFSLHSPQLVTGSPLLLALYQIIQRTQTTIFSQFTLAIYPPEKHHHHLTEVNRTGTRTRLGPWKPNLGPELEQVPVSTQYTKYHDSAWSWVGQSLNG